jgi:hypothetical protein
VTTKKHTGKHGGRPAGEYTYNAEGCSDGTPGKKSPRSGSGSSNRIHATPYRPCPICGRTSRCSSPRDPSGVWLCIGGLGDKAPGWDYLKQAEKDHAWGVYRPANAWTAPATPPPRPRPVDPDTKNEEDADRWSQVAGDYKNALTEERRATLAGLLRLPIWSLDALDIGWDEKNNRWVFPEVDGDERVIGLGTRDLHGNKKTMAGSQRGLTLPRDWKERAITQGKVYVVEGPTDVLALDAAGLPVVGRPSNSGGKHHLVVLLGDLPDVEIKVLGENDRKEDGKFPGRDGAVSVSAYLKQELPDHTVSWALPGGNTKDARDWFVGKGVGDKPGDWKKAGEEFVSNLVPGTEEDGLEAEALRCRLVEEARRAQADYEDWARSLKDKECHRSDGCGQIPRGFRRKGGGPARFLSGLLYCGTCACDGCRRHRQLKVADWGAYTILGDGDVLRSEVYLWQGPVERWGAVRQAMHRAGVGGYTRVHTEDGLVVLADKTFPDCTPARPAAALSLYLGAVLNMVRARQAVTFGGAWVLPEKDPAWESMGHVHPAVLRAVGEVMGAVVSNVWGRRGALLEFLPGTQPWVLAEVERIALLASQLVPRGGEKALGGKCDTAIRQAVALARAEARASMRRGGPPPWTSPEFAEGLREALRARAGKGVAA